MKEIPEETKKAIQRATSKIKEEAYTIALDLLGLDDNRYNRKFVQLISHMFATLESIQITKHITPNGLSATMNFLIEGIAVIFEKENLVIVPAELVH